MAEGKGVRKENSDFPGEPWDSHCYAPLLSRSLYSRVPLYSGRRDLFVGLPFFLCLPYGYHHQTLGRQGQVREQRGTGPTSRYLDCGLKSQVRKQGG